MTETLRIRCSALHRDCPQSHRQDGLRVGSNGDPARTGTAGHSLASAAVLSGERPDFGQIHEVATTNDVADVDELAMLIALWWECWGSLAVDFPDPATEVGMEAELDGVLLTGHADLLSVVDGEPRARDWKFGRGPADASAQVKGYALQALQKLPTAHRAYTAVVRVLDREADCRWYPRKELEDWWSRTAAYLQTDDYNPTLENCRYCPRRLACPANDRQIEQSISTLIGLHLPAGGVAGKTIGQMYDAAEVLQAALERADQAIRFRVSEAGGTLPLGDGRQLELRPTSTTKIDAQLGLPVLDNLLGRDALSLCVTIGKGKMDKTIAAGAAKGLKGKAIEHAMNLLADAGAVHYEPGERLECRRSP